MINRQRTQSNKTQKQTSALSIASSGGMFQSPLFVVQQQTRGNSQQTDLKTSLMRAERYGHHLIQTQPTGISTSAVLQPMNAGKSSNTEVIQMMNGGTQKRRTNYRQTHLGSRAFGKTGSPNLVITELHDSDFGKKVSAKHSESEKFKSAYREPQIQYLPNSGGAGMDERVSTASTAKMRDQIQKETPQHSQQDIHNFVGKVSEERSHVNHLMWITENNESLAGHPGALSKDKQDFRKGVPQEHGKRDKQRAAWVMNEFKDSRNKKDPLNKTAKKVSMQGNIGTINSMSQPHPQLVKANPTSLNNEIHHAKYGQLTQSGSMGNKEWSPQFHKAIVEAHNEREMLKIRTAYDMKQEGYGNLLSDGMQQMISSHKTADNAINERFNRSKPGDLDSGLPRSQASLPDSPMTLDAMKQNNEKAVTTSPNRRLYRAISNPRTMIRPNSKRQANLKKRSLNTDMTTNKKQRRD
ncbi:hypothetical protein H6G06_23560 [Anabaena sphaerica FACHB-251]|uniref:Uncharacterized protein n=1 Tax=Anabaena sphaerica FACHB-251 TaxID=2692883 RepID=A0A927A3D8_9NOST|nr:hypothetical protein [Anabaena sphaerica]MBD2296378.1 hypothetical protein [Anabaena sphaerica FACHB-251]